MTLQDLGLLATILVSVATAAFTAIRTLADRRAGVRSTEHSERRDTVADRDSFIDQLQEQAKSANERAGTADAARRVAEAEAAAARQAVLDEREYAQLLVDHIYRRREPPPPPRPTRS